MKSSYKPLVVAVFLGVAGLISGSLFLPHQNNAEKRGILGGPAPSPALVSIAQGAEVENSAALVQDAPIALMSDNANNEGFSEAVVADQILNDGTAIQDPGQPIGQVFNSANAPAGALQSYKVKSGDTLSGIASHFGVTTNSILSANSGISKKILKIGQILQIPSSGGVGTVNGKAAGASLPNFDSDFIMPAQGYDWGILHNYNAVDIANACGTPVVASADGIVVPDPNIPDILGGWNGGYGNFLLIEHDFGSGILTRYAHLEKIFVQVGDVVKQGQEIGLMGESGEATGCHVHFEVIGAHNPFQK